MKVSFNLNDWCDIFAEQAQLSPHVFWITTLDYKEQLFLGPAFNKVWGKPNTVLYEDLDVFSDFIISDNRSTFDGNCIQRHNENNTGTAIYQIDNGKYIRDRFMTLCDQNGKSFAAAGIAMDVTDKMDLIHNQTIYKNVQDEQQDIYQTYVRQLKDKLNFIAENNQPKPPKITKKEKLCAHYLMQGMTAKQTAATLFISRRTVEKHLDSLKEKFNCTRKIDLVRLLNEYGVFE